MRSCVQFANAMDASFSLLARLRTVFQDMVDVPSRTYLISRPDSHTYCSPRTLFLILFFPTLLFSLLWFSPSRLSPPPPSVSFININDNYINDDINDSFISHKPPFTYPFFSLSISVFI